MQTSGSLPDSSIGTLATLSTHYRQPLTQSRNINRQNTDTLDFVRKVRHNLNCPRQPHSP